MPTQIAIVGSLFVGYALASLLWAPSVNYLAVANLLASTGVFWFGFHCKEPNQIAYWFVAAVAILAPGVMMLGVINSNLIACTTVMALAFALPLNLFWFIPVALVITLLAKFNTGLIAIGILLIIRFWNLRGGALLVILGLVLAIAYVDSSGANHQSIFSRIGIWQDTLRHMTTFGHGFGSYVEIYQTFSYHTNALIAEHLAVASHAYNDVLELLFELGVGAIPLWFLILLAIEGNASKIPLIAFGILSLAYFPFSIPLVAQAFAFALATLLRSRHYGTLETSSASLSRRSGSSVGIQRTRSDHRQAEDGSV